MKSKVQTSLVVVITLVCMSASSISQTAENAVRRGLTYGQHTIDVPPINTLKFSCGGDYGYKCDVIEGDTACQTALPLLCFKDLNLPTPLHIAEPETWAGGLLALTDPVKGERFRTEVQAHKYCANAFGKDWRVVSYHDGPDKGFQSYGRNANAKKRAWINIQSAPKATCWSK